MRGHRENVFIFQKYISCMNFVKFPLYCVALWYPPVYKPTIRRKSVDIGHLLSSFIISRQKTFSSSSSNFIDTLVDTWVTPVMSNKELCWLKNVVYVKSTHSETLRKTNANESIVFIYLSHYRDWSFYCSVIGQPPLSHYRDWSFYCSVIG